MMVDDFVHTRVHALGHRAMGGQERQIREAPDPGKAVEVVAQGHFTRVSLEADRRRDVRQDVVAREDQAGTVVDEDHVAAGVTRSMHRDQEPAGFDLHLVPVPDRLIGERVGIPLV